MQKLERALASMRCGTISFRPFVVTPAGKIFPVEITGTSGRSYLHYRCRYPAGWQDDFHFQIQGDEITCRRYFRTPEKCQLAELGVELNGITFGAAAADDYFYHNENPRIYQRMTFPVDYRRTADDAGNSEFDAQAGNRWADPGVVSERIGRSPYQPFPAILLSNYQLKRGLVHGTLSQKVFYHNYLVSHDNAAIKLEIFSGCKAVAYLDLPAGKILVDEWYLGPTENADDLEQFFARYTAELRRHLPPMYGATAINRNSLVWGSWNDGLFRDISEEQLLREAEFLGRNYPTVQWLQVDDGYAAEATRLEIAHGLGMPYEGGKGVDKQKFPHGLKQFADKIREYGLRPAIWIGGFCPKGTPIYNEHPEWFINYDYRTAKSAPLDPSRAEVRCYMESALDTFFLEFGFEGMKHDFWSYAFEDSHDLLANKDASGYQWRDWWLKEIRKRLPADGYLQTGCDLVMANPFLGEYFTNYRYGIDIGHGSWDCVRTNFLWGVACFALHIGDLMVPNSDSVGLLPGLNDDEALFCLNYCLVTHSMVEIAGLLSQHPDHPRVKYLQKAVCNPNNGQDVYLARYDYRAAGAHVAEILYFNTPHFSMLSGNDALPLRTVGIFNTDEIDRKIAFDPADLKLPAGSYLLTDVWTGELFKFPGEVTFEVKPHASRLFAVSPRTGTPQLLDANKKITDAALNGNVLALTFAHGGEIELLFNQPPKKLPDGFTATGNQVSGSLSCAATVEFGF
ncbi:MAG: alpha-galactosidase [Kiritimatiellales bacterium]